jgi:hypothetical protein
MASLPNYVSDRGHGELCYQVPLKISDVTCYQFVLMVDRSRLQAFVDDQLNVVSGGQVRYTALPFVYNAYLEALHCTSTSETIGYLWDREAAFLVPLLQHRDGHLLPELRFWVPYLLIDSPAGMVTGREVWGYRKSTGTIVLPGGPENPDLFAGETMTFKTFAPETRGEVLRLFEVKNLSPAATPPGHWTGASHAAGEIFGAITAELDKLADGLEKALFSVIKEVIALFVKDPQFPVINLKQLRDAVDSSKACYQALVESPCELNKWSGGGWLPGNFQLQVATCASHQVAQDLGLGVAGPQSTSVPVTFGYWLKMDFSTLAGRVIWQAT